MLTAYLAAFAFGSVLIGASIVLGGKDFDADKDIDLDKDIEFDKDIDLDLTADADVDADADADADGDADKDLALEKADVGGAADALIFNPLLSFRFWTFFLASFGGVGAALTAIGALAAAVVAGVAVPTGFVIGYAAAATFRSLKRNTVRTLTDSRQLGGEIGDVLLTVAPGKRGKIRVRMGGADVELIAVTDEGEIPRGSQALVVRIVDGIAVVTALPSKP